MMFRAFFEVEINGLLRFIEVARPKIQATKVTYASYVKTSLNH